MQAKTLRAIYNMRFKTFNFSGVWQKAFGEPERNGAWLISGAEKHGKTWFSLSLAHYLSTMSRVLYVSAEEGIGKNFQEVCKRANIPANTTMKACEYIPLDTLEKKLVMRRSAEVIFLDNITAYNDELKYGKLLSLLRDYPQKLFVFIAHKEGNKLVTSTARTCSRYAKIIVDVEGLNAMVRGRCPGGTITIDEDKAELYWGM